MASQTTTKVAKSPSNVSELRVPAHRPVAPTPEERATQAAFVEEQMEADQMAALRAEQKRIASEIKALKASQPSRLAKELTRQENLPKWFPVYVANLVKSRVRYGQEPFEATDAVMAMLKGFVDAGLAENAKPADEFDTSDN